MTDENVKEALEFIDNEIDALQISIDNAETAGLSAGFENYEMLSHFKTIRAALSDGGEVDIPSLHSKIDMDCEDEYGREITIQESIAIGTAMKLLAQQGYIKTPPKPAQGYVEAIEDKVFSEICKAHEPMIKSADIRQMLVAKDLRAYELRGARAVINELHLQSQGHLNQGCKDENKK